jgi:hypothetical protein
MRRESIAASTDEKCVRSYSEKKKQATRAMRGQKGQGGSGGGEGRGMTKGEGGNEQE